MKELALVAAFLVASAPAFAKSKAAKHHCVGSDGTEMTSATTKKECKKAGGKWEKEKKMSSKSGTTGEAAPDAGTEPK